MARITKVYCVEEVEDSLLKRIANEANIVSRVASTVKGAVTGGVEGAKKAWKKSGEKPEDFASRSGGSELPASQQILAGIYQVPTGETRLVMFLTDADLTNLYKPANGNEKLVNAFSASKNTQGSIYDAFSGLATPSDVQGKKVFQLITDKFTIKALSQPDSASRNAVLLNIKDQAADFFKGAKKVGSLKEATKILTDALDHRNFIGIVDVTSAKKLLTNELQDSDDIDELLPSFNIKQIVRGYNPAGLRSAAVREWEARAKKDQAVEKPEEQPEAPKSDDDKQLVVKSATPLVDFVVDEISKLGGEIPVDKVERKDLAVRIRAEVDKLLGDEKKDALRNAALATMTKLYPSKKIGAELTDLLFGSARVQARGKAAEQPAATPTFSSTQQLARALAKNPELVTKKSIPSFIKSLQTELEDRIKESAKQ